MRILLVRRKLSILERCPYGEVRLYLYFSLFTFFIYFMGIINTDGKRKKMQKECEQKTKSL